MRYQPPLEPYQPTGLWTKPHWRGLNKKDSQ